MSFLSLIWKVASRNQGNNRTCSLLESADHKLTLCFPLRLKTWSSELYLIKDLVFWLLLGKINGPLISFGSLRFKSFQYRNIFREHKDRYGSGRSASVIINKCFITKEWKEKRAPSCQGANKSRDPAARFPFLLDREQETSSCQNVACVSSSDRCHYLCNPHYLQLSWLTEQTEEMLGAGSSHCHKM